MASYYLAKLLHRIPDASSSSAASSEPRYIWVIAGPAGCGKSTVAHHIADARGLPYLEGDEFHPPENIAKMSSGQPLTDADRWGWLWTLRDAAAAASDPRGCVVACSGLKRAYRDVLRQAQSEHPAIRVRFLFLDAREETLVERVRARSGHYMKEDMVRSQFAVLELPGGDEGDVVRVDCSGDMESVLLRAMEAVLHVSWREA